jgi:hypothetical protein
MSIAIATVVGTLLQRVDTDLVWFSSPITIQLHHGEHWHAQYGLAEVSHRALAETTDGDFDGSQTTIGRWRGG